MDWRTALDFEVLITALEKGYRASVRSPAGRAESDFSVPLSGSEVENFFLELDRSYGIGGGSLSAVALAKDCGGRLFNALFRDSILVLLRRSVNLTQREGTPLRIRLQWPDAPQLSQLPWEYLYNPTTNDFLALSALTPIVRYVPGEAVRPVRVVPSLRILGVISSPRDYPSLDTGAEQDQLERALRESGRGDLLAGGRVVVEWLTRQEGESMLVALQRALRRGDYHVFHFIGHGHFDRRYEQGVLILEDADGRGMVVNGERLGNYLRDGTRMARTLRLAVLNACQAGVPSSRGLPGGVATALVQMGIPAVIAMQAEISDEGAIAFAQSFYAAVADGWPVDLALTEGRKGIYAVNNLEWGKPVLHTCATDGHIFDIAPGLTREEADLQERIANLYAAGRAAMSAQSWRQAVENFEAVLALDPGHREAASYLEVVKKYVQ